MTGDVFLCILEMAVDDRDFYVLNDGNLETEKKRSASEERRVQLAAPVEKETYDNPFDGFFRFVLDADAELDRLLVVEHFAIQRHLQTQFASGKSESFADHGARLFRADA